MCRTRTTRPSDEPFAKSPAPLAATRSKTEGAPPSLDEPPPLRGRPQAPKVSRAQSSFKYLLDAVWQPQVGARQGSYRVKRDEMEGKLQTRKPTLSGRFVRLVLALGVLYFILALFDAYIFDFMDGPLD